jgi:hypothetical protein
MEEYKKIQNYDNYSVSNLGKVRNDDTNKILRTEMKNNGNYEYKYVILYKNGKKNNKISE